MKIILNIYTSAYVIYNYTGTVVIFVSKTERKNNLIQEESISYKYNQLFVKNSILV